MSYILEALRRAERERRAGKAPGMESLTQSATEAAARLPLGIWILAVLTLLLAAAALFLSLHRSSAPAKPVAAPPPVATTEATPVTEAAMPLEPPVAAREEPPPTIANGDELSSLDDMTGEDEAPNPQAPATLVTPRSGNANAGRSGVTPAANEPAAPAPAAPVVQNNVPAAAPASTAAASDQSLNVPKLGDMPESYRAQFPSLTLDVHVYDTDASKRWVMIGGQRYKEGDSLPSGPRIVQIVEGGVVYEYAGQQVLVLNR